MTLLAIAHRAGNDLAALRTAVELGADVLEADVHVRAGRLEVRHSKHLRPLPVLWDRGPGGLELTRTSVPQLELAARARGARRLDGGDARPQGTRPGGRPGRRAGPRRRTRRRRSSSAPAGGRAWRRFAALPWVRPVLTARTPLELRRLRRRLADGPPPWGVSLHRSLLTPAVVAGLRERVEVVMTWGVNDLDVLAQVVDLGVNAVISDEAEVLRRVLARR